MNNSNFLLVIKQTCLSIPLDVKIKKLISGTGMLDNISNDSVTSEKGTKKRANKERLTNFFFTMCWRGWGEVVRGRSGHPPKLLKLVYQSFLANDQKTPIIILLFQVSSTSCPSAIAFES